MHELSIATALVEQIEEIARRNRVTSVSEVELETGQLRQVVPELMRTAFREASAGTVAEGALLRVVEVRALVKCRRCEKIFEPEISDFLCPECQEADVEIIRGDDIILKSFISDKQQEEE